MIELNRGSDSEVAIKILIRLFLYLEQQVVVRPIQGIGACLGRGKVTASHDIPGRA